MIKSIMEHGVGGSLKRLLSHPKAATFWRSVGATAILLGVLLSLSVILTEAAKTTQVHKTSTGSANTYYQTGVTFETIWVQTSATDGGQWWVTTQRLGREGWELKGIKDNDWFVFQRAK